jgi:nucleoside-diphosphate-sugar epimerase
MGRKVQIASDSERIRPANSEVERLLADNSKIRTLLGWKPRHSGLEGLRIGLSKTIDWFSQPENLRLYKSGIYNL